MLLRYQSEGSCMANLTLTPQTIQTGLTPAEADMLAPNNISVTIRNGKRTVEGYNQNGEKVVIQTFINSSAQSRGFRSQTMTVCDQLPVEERREVARRMKNDDKLTQAEIAKRLGVSQKTISNDLK